MGKLEEGVYLYFVFAPASSTYTTTHIGVRFQVGLISFSGERYKGRRMALYTWRYPHLDEREFISKPQNGMSQAASPYTPFMWLLPLEFLLMANSWHHWSVKHVALAAWHNIRCLISRGRVGEVRGCLPAGRTSMGLYRRPR